MCNTTRDARQLASPMSLCPRWQPDKTPAGRPPLCWSWWTTTMWIIGCPSWKM